MRARFLLSIFLIYTIFSSCRIGEDRTTEQKPLESYHERQNAVLKTLTLSFAGDIMAHDVNYLRKPYSRIYESVKHIFLEDDLTFANLEFPVDPQRPLSNYPNFNNHPPYVEAAISAGFDVFSLANNHIGDQGKGGIENTLSTMKELQKQNNIFFSGIKTQGRGNFIPIMIEKRNLKIGFLAITSFINNYSTAELVEIVNYKKSSENEAFVNYISSIAPHYDLFILSFHGGIEYALQPEREKILFFYSLLHAGVDIVWGHHPHVLQPWEMRMIRGATKLIIPSSGNFISGQTWRIDPVNPNPRRVFTGDSAIFSVVVGMLDDEAWILKVKPILISNYKDPDYGMLVMPFEKIFKLENLSEEWENYYHNRLKEIEKITADRKTKYYGR